MLKDELLKLLSSPLNPDVRIYWVYILSAYIIVFLVYLYETNERNNPSLRSYLQFAFPKSIILHRSAILDYKFYFINGVLFAFLFAPFLLTTSVATEGTRKLLTVLWGDGEKLISVTPLTLLLVTIIAAVFGDLGRFLSHYLHHKIPFFWNFHKVHHSAEVLTPITLYRVHPIESVIHTSSAGLFSGISFGIFRYLSSDELQVITILEANAVLFLFSIVGANLRHSHVWIAYPKFLSYLFISPAQHQIHHSTADKHQNKNLGSCFAFWDLFAGTLYIPHKKEQLEFGIGEESSQHHSLFSLYFLPLKENCMLIFSSVKKLFRRKNVTKQ